MTLDVTPGGTNSNAYCTVTEADTYNSSHPASADWTGTTAEKENCIKTATTWLDFLCDWFGYKVTKEQALRWPRSSVRDLDGYTISHTTIPIILRNATADLARHIKKTGDLSAEPDGKGIKSIAVDSVITVYDKHDIPKVLPSSVAEMLRGFGVIASTRSSSISTASISRT